MTKTKTDIIDQGLKAALELAGESSWDAITLSAIAERAGLTLSDFQNVADKDGLADHVEAYFDAAMNEGSFSEDETPRTRLFDVLMLRFEEMEDDRAGLVSLMEWRSRQPARLLNLLSARRQTASWALTCAGLDASGKLPKPIRLTALTWVIGQAERAWRKETSPDFSRTMAALDGELRRMDERADWITSFGRKKAAPTDSAEQTASDPSA